MGINLTARATETCASASSSLRKEPSGNYAAKLDWFMDVTDTKKLKALESENSKLKKLLAE